MNYGKWETIGEPFIEKGHTKQKCRCECGRESQTRLSRLIQGESTCCCSCAAKVRNYWPDIKEGDVFGQWTVVVG